MLNHRSAQPQGDTTIFHKTVYLTMFLRRGKYIVGKKPYQFAKASPGMTPSHILLNRGCTADMSDLQTSAHFPFITHKLDVMAGLCIA